LSQRLLWVDALRGTAIVLMVVFHFCYDLRYFGYVDWHIPNGPNWWPFRYLILSLFIFTVGISLVLAHQPHFRGIEFVKRLAQLFFAAAAITVMSLFLFPEAWIYFGILHFIAFASLLSLPFVWKPQWALIIGAMVLITYNIGLLSNNWPFYFFSDWVPDDTEDYVPLFPWLGIMLLGMGIGSLIMSKTTVKISHTRRNKKKNTQTKMLDLPSNKVTNLLAVIGKRGLFIYLIHQPLLFLGFYTIQFFS